MELSEIKVGQILRIIEHEPEGSYFTKNDIVKVVHVNRPPKNPERTHIQCNLISRPSDPDFETDETNFVHPCHLVFICKLKQKRDKKT